MKTILGVILVAFSTLASPDVAECASCPTFTCYARCTNECACVRGPGSKGGQCWSVEAVPQLQAAGWEELP